VRAFLAIPETERTRPATLADVRDRLLAAARPAGAGRPPSDAEESINLLLPIVLLNLGRHRTREGRALGMSALAALIRRGRGW
jgi:type III secretion regulatory protein HpaA